MNQLTKFIQKYNEIVKDTSCPCIKTLIADPIFFPGDKKQYVHKEIIIEDKNKQINIGNQALGYLKSKLKNQVTQIDMYALERKIWIHWPHYNDFYINCLDKKLALLEADFLNPEIVAQKIDIFINHDIQKQELLNILKTSMIGTCGLTLEFENDLFIILIDQNHKKSTEIMHQFTHFVQLVTGEFKIQNKPLIKNMCKQFELNDQDIEYIFNQNQFWPNIYNDLFDNLQKIYWSKFNKAFQWEDFITSGLKFSSQNINQFKNSFIYKNYKQMNLSHLWYLNVLAAIAYADKKFFNQIIERLKNK